MTTETLLQEGLTLPATSFFVLKEGKAERVSSTSLFATGRSLLFGMPGAFTPTCSQDHLPEVLRARPAFRKLGVARIACMTTQDPFVMQKWRTSYGALAEEKDDLPPLFMLSDASLEATRAFGMETDLSSFGLGIRCLRFAAILEQGAVRWLSARDARGECRLSSANAVLESLARP